MAESSARSVSGRNGRSGGFCSLYTDIRLELRVLLLAYAGDTHEVLLRAEGAMLFPVLHDCLGSRFADARKRLELLGCGGIDVHEA